MGSSTTAPTTAVEEEVAPPTHLSERMFPVGTPPGQHGRLRAAAENMTGNQTSAPRRSRSVEWLRTQIRELVRELTSRARRLRPDPWALQRTGQEEFFRRAFFLLKRNGISGDYAEFGCWSGTTFAMAFRESRRVGMPCKLWALDSFEGLPAPNEAADKYPGWNAGEMRMSLDEFRAAMDKQRIPTSVFEMVPGFYGESLNERPGHALPQDIGLAFIDCDLYTSTKSVLAFLMRHLKHGMIVAFDDYYCDSANQVAGERRAMREIVQADTQWHWLPYFQFGWSGMSFIIENAQSGGLP